MHLEAMTIRIITCQKLHLKLQSDK